MDWRLRAVPLAAAEAGAPGLAHDSRARQQRAAGERYAQLGRRLGLRLPRRLEYLAGSACLLVDALLQAWPFCSSTPSTGGQRISQLLTNLDVHAGLFYVLAGGFGGYASETSLLRFGNCCWLVGSLISGVNPCLDLSAGAQRRERASCAPPVGETPKGVELEAKAACTVSAV